MYLWSSYFITLMGRSGLYSSDGLSSSRCPYISVGGLLASTGRGGPAFEYGLGGLIGLGGMLPVDIRPGSLACSAGGRGGPLWGYACGVP